MISKRIVAGLAGLMLSMGVTTQVWAQSAQIDPAATKMLQQMTDYLSNLPAVSVHTQNTLEHVLDNGQRIDEDISVSMTFSRPDKLRAERLGELINQEFYYDGKALSIINQKDKVYATESAPGTIEEMLDFARESLGLVLPASDLAYRNVHAIMMENVVSATVVGKAVINDKVCHQLAFSRTDVDFQVWIEQGDHPLPCKYVVTDKSTPELVSTTSVMSNWNVKPNAPGSSFNFVPGKDLMKVDFLPLEINDSGANK